jgi:hypothetical protein
MNAEAAISRRAPLAGAGTYIPDRHLVCLSPN